GAGVGLGGGGVGPEGAEPLTAGGDRVPAAVGAARARRQLIATIKDSLRGLSSQLSQLNHQVSARVDLKDVDLHCLDLLAPPGAPPSAGPPGPGGRGCPPPRSPASSTACSAAAGSSATVTPTRPTVAR